MVRLQIKMSRAEELRAALSKRPALLVTQARQIVQKHGAQLQSKTMSNMAGAYTAGYSTGATARSVTLTLSQAGMTATVAPHTDYSAYLEYGTRFMAAKPTIKPAFIMQELKFVSDLQKLMK